MKVCDRCKSGENPIISKLKIKGKDFELCKECSECVVNYIKFSYEPSKGLTKFLKNFGN